MGTSPWMPVSGRSRLPHKWFCATTTVFVGSVSHAEASYADADVTTATTTIAARSLLPNEVMMDAARIVGRVADAAMVASSPTGVNGGGAGRERNSRRRDLMCQSGTVADSSL